MLRLLSDEDVPGDIVFGLRRRQPGLSIVRVQEVGLMNTPDPDVLAWAAGEDRQVFTRDRNTMTGCAWDRVRRGEFMPGLFVLPEDISIGQAIVQLEALGLHTDSQDWHNQVIYLRK